jgi:hypothetical protein
MAIAQNFPTISPSLSLDFAAVQALDPKITYARASTATYYGTRTALAEQNLVLQSQAFDTASWTKTNVTATADSTTAPDGTTTADSIITTATNAVHRVQQITTGVGAFTFSVFVKANGYSKVGMWDSATTGAYAAFDLSTGAVLDSGAGASSVTITALTNSWYRISFVATMTASIGFAIQVLDPAYTTGGINNAWLADGTSGVFLWGAQLEQRSTVTAYNVTTTQPITTYIPVLETAAAGVARFDHNPVTFESLGLLVEQQSTNLLLQSEDLDTTWSETRATLSLNSVVAPNGTLTADVLIASTDNNTHFTTQTFTGTAVSHTFSAYAKANGLNHVALRLFNGSTQVGLAYYNLSTGATGTVTAGTASIQAVGNGWYRCSLTATLAASASCTADIFLANADNTNSFAGNAFDGVTLWGFQIGALAFPTSYIPTVASQVTRAVDNASMTGTNFTSWFNNAEFSLYQDIQFQTSSPVRIGDTFANNIETIRNNAFSAQIFGSFGGTAFTTQSYNIIGSSSYPSGSFVANQRQVAAIAMSLNSFASGYSGAGATATPTYNPAAGTFSGLYFGGAILGANFSGRIRKIAFYPKALTATNLQALTG